MKKRTRTLIIIGATSAATLFFAVPALAAEAAPTSLREHSPRVAKVFSSSILFGTVEGISGSVITITEKTQGGVSARSIGIGSKTSYKENGVAAALGSITVGERIVARGQKDSGGNIMNAVSVNVMKPHTK